MKAVSLGAAALALSAATAASASVVTVGGSLARTCYESAQARLATPQTIEECSRALNEEPLSTENEVATHVNRGILMSIRGDVQSAESDFDKALAINPNQPEAWLNKGLARYRAGDLDAAAQMLDRAIDLRVSSAAYAYYARAVVNEDRGNLRAAYADYRQAATLDPNWDAPAAELRRYKLVQK